MAYVIEPNSGQTLGQTRDNIRNNFSLIQNKFDVNHYDFDAAGALPGKHQFITLPNSSSTTIPVTGPDEIILEVSKNAGSTGNRLELFYNPEGGATTTPQISGFVKNSVNGQAAIFGGFSLKWGKITGLSSGTSAAFTYASTFSLNAYVTATYSIHITSNTAGDQATYSAVNVSNTGFKVNRTLAIGGGPVTADVFWIAIGY